MGQPVRIGDLARFYRGGRLEIRVKSTRIAAVLFEWWLLGDRFDGISEPPSLDEIAGALGGRDLACWCPLDQACHADVLLRIANDHGLTGGDTA